MTSTRSAIQVFGAREHNLRDVNVTIPRGAITVITGLSGSGKSSLAFDTIYAEGQRRYVESLSTYARQFLEQMQKPDVDRIEGLCPTIAVEQRGGGAGPRSTVATTTEIHDLLRVLFARAGEPRCWVCDRPIVRQTTTQIVDAVLSAPAGQRILVLAPVIVGQRGQHRAVIERLMKEGFVRARIDGPVVMLEDPPALAPTKRHDIDVIVDRLTVKAEAVQRLADSVELATRLSRGRVLIAAEVAPEKWEDQAYSAALACPVHPEVRLDELSPQLFSFNAPQGACDKCHGLGTTLEFDVDLVAPDHHRALAQGAIAAWRGQGRRLTAEYGERLREFCERFQVPPDAPLRNIPTEALRILMHGATPQDEERYGGAFEGVLPNLQRRWATTGSEGAKQRLHAFLGESPCDACRGARLNARALCVKVDGRSVAEISRMTIEAARRFFNALSLSGERAVVAKPLVEGISRRLGFLHEVGVEYLTLDRASVTLSGGEFQRTRLATQIGSGLSGVCYVLDEPTIGLHPRDSRRLGNVLARLAEMDNTVIVVEHDEEIIRGAHYLIDIGPGAGPHGGNVVVQGPLQEALTHTESSTVRFLTGQTRIEVPTSGGRWIGGTPSN